MAMDKNITLTINGKSKPTQTNYDRIKSMSVEEMVKVINENYKCKKCAYYRKVCNTDCINGIKKWLLQEVSDE